MDIVRWGVLSTAKIGIEKVIPAMQQGRYSRVTAIASRRADKARRAAAKLGIAASFGSYEALLADNDVDAVYIPLPNHLHVPWCIQALEAGKHVLCEKPLAMTYPEAQSLLAATAEYPELKIMEAFMYRHHPQWLEAKGLVAEGRIGTLRTVHSFFSYFNDEADNIRNLPEAGGGGLMDIGCYCISLARFIFDAEPRRVCGTLELDSRFGTDRMGCGLLEFDRGTATFTCGTQLFPYQRVNIYGTRGRIEIEIPFNAPPDRPCRMSYEDPDGIHEIELPLCDQYRIQGDLMSQSILEDRPVPTPLSDGVANMRVVEAIKTSANSGNWVSL